VSRTPSTTAAAFITYANGKTLAELGVKRKPVMYQQIPRPVQDAENPAPTPTPTGPPEDGELIAGPELSSEP
jgi:hypothetical protein